MAPIRLLIVEDDRQIAEIQKRFVERLEPVELCGIAHTLADARDLIDVLAPELVLLDVYFPDGNGLDLLRELRARDSSVDVILITAAKEVDTLRSALRVGVFDYILKPLVFERLQDAIQRYRDHLGKLATLNHLAQKEVDALLPRGGGEDPQGVGERLPKGIDALTLDKVRELIARGNDWSAEEMGAALGASRTTARRYLEYLVGTGELGAEVTYGSVGRPERRYRQARHGPQP
ncbi:response regulator [Marinobacter lutaoensis]|mgnify:FL=1|jgi:two-component system CitB family response regulator|uniref:Transcriptional regulatory protein n=1 Tax=Marinobacter lutaoensis TaxID=135739 RepID=A0A1V2DQV8_9GAMM|nr:response regulator [Marinobacter lutaoensis]MBE03261.1 two-component system response regulator [Marinobacter sp.]MBI44212.1 two-component system response regulator [Oceanospirillales bacterium]NVD36158.1 response regulator [Marinobacter lutaoensis]ONF43013.1 two-component system response regulator [Marinobacter lutaoensis]|tara:strand:- start:389 stop:1090 length:702 start_codon:yes stop_codon:yes gene_type:complete